MSWVIETYGSSRQLTFDVTSARASRRSSLHTRRSSRRGRGSAGGSTRRGGHTHRAAPRCRGARLGGCRPRPFLPDRRIAPGADRGVAWRVAAGAHPRGERVPRRGRRRAGPGTGRGASPPGARAGARASLGAAAADPGGRADGRGGRRRRPDRVRDEPAAEGAGPGADGAGSRALAAASVANLEVDAERSILLALEAIDRTRSVDGTVLPEAEEALHRAVTASRIVLSVPGVGGALDWSPTGVFVTEGPEDSGIVDIRDAGSGQSVIEFPGHDVDVNDVRFSPDGSMLATTGDDGALKVWDRKAVTYSGSRRERERLGAVVRRTEAWCPRRGRTRALSTSSTRRTEGSTARSSSRHRRS